MIRVLSLSLLILILSFGISPAEELIQAPAAIQVSSIVSDGKHSIQKIIDIARKSGIKVLILNERDYMRWEYGLSPLRKVVKKTIEANSIATYGIKNYLKSIERAGKDNPDLVLIAGVESAPFYYWSGSPFGDDFRINNWHRHLLVIGLEGVSDYRGLPSVANRHSPLSRFDFRRDFYLILVPTLLLAAGFQSLRKRSFHYSDLAGHELGPYSRVWRVSGIILIAMGLIFFFNNFPFRSLKYDQYHADQGKGPYQDLIDYVGKKGGMVFWAHPEVENIRRQGRVAIETKPYQHLLLETRGYTGYTVHYGGSRVGIPAGIWDQALKEYCRGERKNPVWAIGGLGFDQQGDLAEYIKDLRTMILVPRLGKKEVIKALGQGKMYVVKGVGELELILDEFRVKDSLSGAEAGMGDQIDLEGDPVIKIRGHLSGAEGEAEGALKIKLIREGVVIKEFEGESPFEIEYQDGHSTVGKKTFYRLEIYSPKRMIISNPVFVNPVSS
ncbi:hypothetical protein ACFLZ3_04100 [Candidatus Omnitrophota bacterium]